MTELKQRRNELDNIIKENNSLTLEKKSAEMTSRTLMNECKTLSLELEALEDRLQVLNHKNDDQRNICENLQT